MRHRMRAPDVDGVERDRVPARALRRLILAAFLEAESVAAEGETVERRGRIPCGDRAPDGIAHAPAVAGIEQQILHELQRNNIARIAGKDPFENFDRARLITRDPSLECLAVEQLARRRTYSLHRGIRRLQRLPRARNELAL